MTPSAALPTFEPNPLLRILLIEDGEVDALAFRRALERSDLPCEITHYYRAEEALEELDKDAGKFDLAVADHYLPGMFGLDFCLEVLRRDDPCALALLTGSGSAEVAVKALEAGVDEYIVKDSKSGYLDLLPVVLPRVVRRFEERQARRRVEEALRQCDERFRRLAENARDLFWVASLDWSEFLYVSPAFREIWGRTCDALYEEPETWFEAIHEEDRGRVREALIERQESHWTRFRVRRPDESMAVVECRVFGLKDAHERTDRLAGIAREVTGGSATGQSPAIHSSSS